MILVGISNCWEMKVVSRYGRLLHLSPTPRRERQPCDTLYGYTKRDLKMPKLSGKYWVQWANTHAKTSSRLNDLNPIFRGKVTAFIHALGDAGADVKVLVTRRSAKRAYLFHWSWMIAFGRCKPSEAKKMAGVDINWDHGNLTKSKNAAMEMVRGFGLAQPPASIYPPSLTSNHISGRAIDMLISWHGTIQVKKKNGDEVAITYTGNSHTSAALRIVGASYGVNKLLSDKAHWSYNGH